MSLALNLSGYMGYSEWVSMTVEFKYFFYEFVAWIYEVFRQYASGVLYNSYIYFNLRSFYPIIFCEIMMIYE